MNLFRTINSAVLLALSGAGFTGCIQAPDYPTTPEIDFKEARLEVVPGVGGTSSTNNITFVLNFRDGDGDLGLSQEDIKIAPYNQAPTAPLTIQRLHTTNEYNYYIQPFKKVNGVFVPFVTPPPPRAFGKLGEYDSTYPRLDGTDAKPAPLKGELRYVFPIVINGDFFNAGDVFKFELTILDRALHISNTVTSSEITLSN